MIISVFLFVSSIGVSWCRMDWQRDIRPTYWLSLTAGLLLPQVLCYPALPCRRKPSRSRQEKSSYTSTSAPRPPCRIDSATPASHRKLTGTASPSSIHGCWRKWVSCSRLRSTSGVSHRSVWVVGRLCSRAVNRIYRHYVTTSCYVILLFLAQLVLAYSMSNLKGIVHRIFYLPLCEWRLQEHFLIYIALIEFLPNTSTVEAHGGHVLKNRTCPHPARMVLVIKVSGRCNSPAWLNMALLTPCFQPKYHCVHLSVHTVRKLSIDIVMSRNWVKFQFLSVSLTRKQKIQTEFVKLSNAHRADLRKMYPSVSGYTKYNKKKNIHIQTSFKHTSLKYIKGISWLSYVKFHSTIDKLMFTCAKLRLG